METTQTPAAPETKKHNCQTCPQCGWILVATKTGKVRKHGRAQTGRSGGCPGSGQTAEVW